MSCEDFVKRYEAAIGTQDWAMVAPLIAETARVVFSDGSLHAGKEAIRAAYMRNFAMIENEDFRIENVQWLVQGPESAAYMFEFHWTGVIQGREAAGAGRGTAVLRREGDDWRLVAEHLGPLS